MRSAECPTIERLRELLEYRPGTGELVRRVSSGGLLAGSIAGGRKSSGYVYVSVDDHRLLAHRVIWAMQTGHYPQGDIDHIDGDRANNRWTNLRQATRAQNMQNERRARRNGTSGYLGVSWSRAAGRWAAAIKRDGKAQHLGLFDDPKVAHAAYVEAKRRLHPFGML